MDFPIKPLFSQALNKKPAQVLHDCPARLSRPAVPPVPAHGPVGPWAHGPMGPMVQWAHGSMGAHLGSYDINFYILSLKSIEFHLILLCLSAPCEIYGFSMFMGSLVIAFSGVCEHFTPGGSAAQRPWLLHTGAWLLCSSSHKSRCEPFCIRTAMSNSLNDLQVTEFSISFLEDRC